MSRRLWSRSDRVVALDEMKEVKAAAPDAPVVDTDPIEGRYQILGYPLVLVLTNVFVTGPQNGAKDYLCHEIIFQIGIDATMKQARSGL